MSSFSITEENFIELAQLEIPCIYFFYKNDWYFFCQYNDYMVFMTYSNNEQSKDAILAAFGESSTRIF